MECQNSSSLPTSSPPHAMTYDEASMERSRSFISALQELKNLRQQLYSAAEYCESSYLYSEQKHVVLDNLKDYTVKALVNAVDHLGTVAFKLNELLSQQTTEVSTADVRVACLAQRICLCKEHTDREGLKQQQLIKDFPRFHKRYILPAVSGEGHGESTSSQGAQSESLNPGFTGATLGRSLSWNQATEVHPLTNRAPVSKSQHSARSGSSRIGADEISSAEKEAPRSVITKGTTSAPVRASIAHTMSSTPHARSPASSVDSTKSFSTMSYDARHGIESHQGQSRTSKSRIFSILGRRRSAKEKVSVSP